MNEEIIKLYLEDNLSILYIANKFNLGYKKVRNFLLKNNVKLRKKNTIGLHNHNEETKNKMRVSKIGYKNPMFGKCSEATKNNLKKCKDKTWNDPIKKAEIYKKASQTRIKNGLSKGDKNPMANDETVKKWAASNYNKLKPNKQELKLFQLIQRISNNFRLNTLGETIIEGKIPDIIDTKNKKVIELYGDYWHRNDTIEDELKRENLFKKNYYSCLIIWERELKNELKLLEKLSNFIKTQQN